MSCRISCRITTDIRRTLSHSNTDCCNEPFAVSLLTLIHRHAWLNLRYKHMTTGRINQVTSLQIMLISELSTQHR